MKNKKTLKEKGITLIALVITIIVLLILAGVSIAMLTGDNGIVTQANNAKVEQSHGAVKEGISLAYNEWQLEINISSTTKLATTQITSIPTKKSNFKEGLSLDFLSYLLKEKEVIDETGKIDTKKLTGVKQPVGNGKDFKDVYIIKEVEDEYVLYYYDNGGKEEALWSVNIGSSENIGSKDTIAPNKATATMVSTTLENNNSIVERINQTDDEAGAVDFEKCKWIYNTESEEIGIDESKYTNSFTKQDEEITLTPSEEGTHYLHILTVDTSGNKTETIIRPVIIKISETIGNEPLEIEAKVQTENGDEITNSSTGYLIFNKVDSIDSYYSIVKNTGSMANINEEFKTEINIKNNEIIPDQNAINDGYSFSENTDSYGIFNITPYSRKAVGPSGT